jgi:hypothetical protein
MPNKLWKPVPTKSLKQRNSDKQDVFYTSFGDWACLSWTAIPVESNSVTKFQREDGDGQEHQDQRHGSPESVIVMTEAG